MSKPVVNLHLMGRWGNSLFQMAFALAYAEKYGYELHCDQNWIGYKIFDLPPCKPITQDLPKRNEDTANGDGDIGLEGYFQNQKSIDLYTRTKCKEWFRWKRGIINKSFYAYPYIAYHVRRGDFQACGYPLISEDSYTNSFNAVCGNLPGFRVSDEKSIDGEMSFLSDFTRLMLAEKLIRANSSFSYWAAVLADESQRVFAPVIDSLEGGCEHDDVRFVEGNWPRLANFSFTTDLHLKP